MSLFEWWGESINPGPVGGVEFGDDPRRAPADPTWVLIRLVLSCAVLVGAWILVFGHYAVEVNAHNVGIAAAVAFSYLGLAWLIRPQADFSNMGWAGGLIDNPFRYSDDLNRTLLFLTVVLFPGRLIADSLGDSVRLVLGR
ncbi:MAG: hypothetical protein KDD82_30800 [Planctomycetes bacterium]|nr:hypothetical protein [Planctomycetota bacterium]